METSRENLKIQIELFFRTEGRELIFEVLDEYFKNNNCKTNDNDECDKKNTPKNAEPHKQDNLVIKEIIKNFPEIFENENMEEEDNTYMIERLKKFISSLKKENNELKSDKENLEECYRQKVKEIEVLENKRCKMEEENFDLNKNIKILISTKTELSKEIENLRTEKSKSEETISRLISEKRNIEKEISSLNSEKENLNIQNAKLNEKIEKIINESQKEREKLKELYKLQNLYTSYKEMPEEIKLKLKGLIKYDDVNSFIACCFSITTMDDLWDFINEEIKKDNNLDLTVLKEIFSYFVEQQNKKYSEAIYRVLVPKCGEEFDPREHTSANGAGEGKVSEVIFPGYGILNEKTDAAQKEEDRKYKKIKKPAIVKSN